jgi:hypothetical protein
MSRRNSHVWDKVPRRLNYATYAIIIKNGPFDSASTFDVDSGANALHMGIYRDDGSYEVKKSKEDVDGLKL